MVLTKNVDNRWVRRYRIFFLIGIVILSFQIYLAIRFFGLSGESSPNTDIWNPHKLSNIDSSNDIENSVSLVRRTKDGVGVDDEDLMNTDHIQHRKINSTISKTSSQLHLRVEELDFIPLCDIQTKEAISAIHRAKTQKCKQQISNITCLIVQGVFYPKELPNYCPNDGFTHKKSLGCFKDEKTFRLLNGYYGNYKSSNSPDSCINLCLQSGFLYAGVEYSTECFCGNDEPTTIARLPDSSCNMKCPANRHAACGGYLTINIYETGIAKFVPQVARTNAAPNEKRVKIVFLLTLNGRALRQVRRLIKILYHQDHFYYIHVDVRQDYLFRELLPLEKQFPNIRLTRRRFSTIWGGASLLQMLLSTMQELLNMKWDWDFIINLSESDYPVKTLNKLVEFLTANKGKNFVKSHGRETQRFIQKQGLDKTFVECDTHMWRIGDRKLPWGIQVDGGSDWVGLSRNFVAYASNSTPDTLVTGLLVVFNHTLLPAESFFHTVLKNSRFCDTYIENNLHVTNWKRKLGCKCQYKHIVDWCGCSPNDFRPEDWLRVQNTESRQIFFARKFEPVVNQAVILQLEEWLYNINLSNKNIININSYWQSTYHHLDLTQVDDSFITVAQSVARIKFKKCNINHHKILEITSFHHNDSYCMTLFLFLIENAKFETLFKHNSDIILNKDSALSHRLKSLTVSTDYDPKEQILRNFAQIMGPYSDPTLAYEFNSSSDISAKITNITVLWIDPAGRLIEVSNASLEDGYVIGYIKPNFAQPLLPGKWTVKLISKINVFAEIKFLITPLEFYSGNTILQNQVGFVNSGSPPRKQFNAFWKQFLPNKSDAKMLLSKSIANSQRFGPDLQEWIDSLIQKFYHVGDICIVGKMKDVCGIKLQSCAETYWSSFAPDPKSFLGKINPTTGGFDLW